MRCRRVADSLRKEISSMLLLQEVKDPRISFVTIIDVAVSPDMRIAEVYYTVHGSDDEKQETLSGLQSSAGFIRRVLGKRLHLKRIPELKFRYDETLDQGFHIDKLLAELDDCKDID
ncbi:MAG: 30S ribosome-binding factor RbfA [Xanthomonadaceae bacterium]|nr:30S ribosome-binding factor RbfA [Xanthomonadaceae bacterium]